MPFTLIKGAFRVVGTSPDGDSIRFFPDNMALINALPGPAPITRPFVQLRLEGIDSLETHYAARHQPLELANSATERLLAFVGIGDVVWDARHTTIIAASDDTRGWILAREREKNNRPVAFVFAGKAKAADGSAAFLDRKMLRKSFNHLALAEGLAYPTFYQGLFAELRRELTDASMAARDKRRPLWTADRTNLGFDAKTLAVIMDDVPILPKLFRRLSDYMAATGTAVGFKEALAASPDAVWDLQTQNRTHLDTFVEQARGSTKIRLTRMPEELVFDPMPAVPSKFFAAMVGAPIRGDGP